MSSHIINSITEKLLRIPQVHWELIAYKRDSSFTQYVESE